MKTRIFTLLCALMAFVGVTKAVAPVELKEYKASSYNCAFFDWWYFGYSENARFGFIIYDAEGKEVALTIMSPEESNSCAYLDNISFPQGQYEDRDDEAHYYMSTYWVLNSQNGVRWAGDANANPPACVYEKKDTSGNRLFALQPGTYYLRVFELLYDSETGTASMGDGYAQVQFTLSSHTVKNLKAIVAPDNQTATISWSDSTTFPAETYLYMNIQSGPTVVYDNYSVNASPSNPLNINVSEGRTYSVTVQCLNYKNEPQGEPVSMCFTVGVNPYLPTTLETYTAQDNYVTFSWNATSQAACYRINIYQNGTTYTSFTATEKQLTKQFPSGSYTWEVAAYEKVNDLYYQLTEYVKGSEFTTTTIHTSEDTIEMNVWGVEAFYIEDYSQNNKHAWLVRLQTGQENGSGLPEPWIILFSDKKLAISGSYSKPLGNLDFSNEQGEGCFINTDGTTKGLLQAADALLRLDFEGFDTEYQAGYSLPYYSGEFFMTCSDGKTYHGIFNRLLCSTYEYDSSFSKSVLYSMTDEDTQPQPPTGTLEINDNDDDIENVLETLIGDTTDITIHRTLSKNGSFNTLCLPFSLSASEIEASDLAGCELFAYDSTAFNDSTLYLYIKTATAIEAGKPYLIRWADGDTITQLNFTNVKIETRTGQSVGTDVQFVGTLGQTTINGNNYLFVGANNMLFWPSTDTNLKGFRAYFNINDSVVPLVTRARLVIQPEPTSKIDVITYQETGMKGETKTYADFTISDVLSGATYILNAYDGENINFIQMRSNKNNSGLVTTKSAGLVRSVEITFNEKTTDRKVNVYGSNTAFTSPTELYADGPVLVGTIAADAADKKLTFTDSYQYVGIRSLDGAIYMDEIDITWGGTTPVTPVAVTGVTLNKTTASIKVGRTITLTATVAPSYATNKAVTWESSNTAVATVANGVVTAVAAGTATITVASADGNYTDSCAVSVYEGVTPAENMDVITYQETGMKGETKTYADFTITGMTSGASYIVHAYDGEGLNYIQMHSKNNNSGLVSTVSGGTVQSVEIKFNEKTTDRKVYIYGSNTAFTSPTELYAEGLTPLDSIGAADATKKRTISGNYRYIGIRSSSGAIFIDEIDIEWGNFEEKATTILKFKSDAAEVEVGETVALEVERDGNDAITWKTSDASIATVDNGVVKGIKEGTVKITATANNISDECTVTVKKATTPDEVPAKTIAEFIAAQGGKCKLIGIVGKIDNDLYGNFNLTDNSGTIYVYGLLTAEGESKKFNTLGVEEGDTLTVIAETYKLYNEKPEVVNAIFVEVKKGSGVTPTHHDGPLDVNYAEAAYLEDEKGPFWEVFAAKIDDENSMDYPILIMHIDNTNKTHLAGEFNAFYTVLYMSENDSIESADSKVVIRCVKLAADELSAPVYHFIDTLHDEAGKEYIYEFETEVWAYDRKDSTNEEIIWIDLEDPVQGYGETETTYTITTEPNNPEWGTTSGDKSALYLDEIEISATPNYGYHFIQWSDGEKVNPRTVIITQDTIFEAVFAPDTTGTCGKNYALTWAYNASTKTLTISGNGSFDEHMECGIEAKQDMEKLVINEGVTALGAQAFSNCANLTFVQLPASLKTIGEKAFYNCLELTSIYNYRPNPCLIETNTFEKVNTFDCVLYVLAESIAKYRSEASGWKIFYEIKPIGGTAVDGTITDVETQPNDNHVVVTWPVSTDAATYTIQITQNGVVFCTLIFDSNGQLTGIAFGAPDRNSRNHAPAAAKTSNGGLRFTVTGLDGGTQYHLTVDAKDKNGDSVASYETSFETLKAPEVATAIDNVQSDKGQSTKVFRDGQLLILRGDKTYTLQGQEVK